MRKLILIRDFLYWFLDTQRLKWPNTAKVLEYILKNESILEKVELVDDIRFYRNALMVSGRGTVTFPFVLRLDGKYIHDVEEALQALASANFYKLYVKLSYSKDYYQGVVSKKRVWKVKRAGKKKKIAYQKLMLLIDAALDRRDREEFYRLTKQLQRLSNV
ncbi:YpiB family protein [Zhaonella formicivorans]|uniref:YpiB family protein n=1 Tax=Zhaonella formicivorans TaxID=2528593 RepID=UPI0010D675C3|nr:YpiB family protein [Zhaonella formicivorans]